MDVRFSGLLLYLFSDFNDAALIAPPVAAKRLKLETSSNVATVSSGNAGKMSTADFVRRSNRKQKIRGEKEFHVSSDMLLRDLKVKVNSVGQFVAGQFIGE